jgi:hypothetical protein
VSLSVPATYDADDGPGASVIAGALGTLLCFAVAECRGGRHNALSALALIRIGGKYAD